MSFWAIRRHSSSMFMFRLTKIGHFGPKMSYFWKCLGICTIRNLRLNTKKCGGDKLSILWRASIWAILLSYISIYKVRLTKWANLVCSRKIPWHISLDVSEVWRLVSLKYTSHLPSITSASILALKIGYRMEDLDIGVSTFWWNMRIFILGSSKKVLQEVQKYKKN